MKGSLDLMSVGIGKEKRKKDTVAENTTSEKPGTDQKELGDVKCVSVCRLFSSLALLSSWCRV